MEMRLGRDGASCALLVSDPSVSSFHATLKLEAGQLWIRDENSNNGTLVNGEQYAQTELKRGDTVVFSATPIPGNERALMAHRSWVQNFAMNPLWPRPSIKFAYFDKG